ncbi:1-acyl-sn-glycerol-3-phosphate acyltransferase [Acidocella sp.]|uniref:lysophospholipid acyltransferase family protein n=1 Tax=Acidocella sp. TaxID=50710 RepID=UPI00263131A1|nr:lysophospholipid acyltransferase family protein [Acidocella sp.]
MRLLRSAVFNIVMFGSCGLLSLWCALAAWTKPDDRVLVAARIWARICFWSLRVFCGITLRAEGFEALPPGGTIIAAQHQSALDILVWIHLLPRPAFVFKRELKRIPVFGQLLEPSGMIPVDRGGGRVALRAMVAGATQAIAAGRQIVIFPEGTRVAPHVRGHLRHGIAALEQAGIAPIFPASTDSGVCWGRRAFAKTPGIVRVTLHAPLPPGLRREAVLARLATLYYGEPPARLANEEAKDI